MDRESRWMITAPTLLAVLIVGGLLWLARLYRVPELEIPKRHYPALNAYEQLRQIGINAYNAMRRIPNYGRLEQIMWDNPNRLKPGERESILKAMQPYLREYPRYLNQPSVAIFEYSPYYSTLERIGLRRLALAQALQMRAHLRQGRDREAVEGFQNLLLLGTQIRNDGLLLHHFTGMGISMIAWRVFAESPHLLDEPAALEQMVEAVRLFEQRRPPLWQAYEHERYSYRAFLQELARNPAQLEYQYGGSIYPEGTGLPRPLLRPTIWRAIGESERLIDGAIKELQKPTWQRDYHTALKCSNVLLRGWGEGLLEAIRSDSIELAWIRLLGCVAAIRLHKLRTGRYPDTLNALGLGTMSIDPFTGKPFVYKLDPQQGFLIYSVGVNQRDEGGRFVYGNMRSDQFDKGDLVPVFRPASAPSYAPASPLAEPVWLR